MMKSIRLNAIKCQADEISVEHYNTRSLRNEMKSISTIFFLEVEFHRVPVIVFVYDFFKVDSVAFEIASVV